MGENLKADEPVARTDVLENTRHEGALHEDEILARNHVNVILVGTENLVDEL